MRIRTFCKFIDCENLRDHTLNDSTVVIDGQNYFYRLYKQSGLQFVFGCESDKYALFLRKHLEMYQKANVKCFIIFKGGHENLQKRLNHIKTDHLDGRDFTFGQEDYPDIVLPIFMKDVYKQVLDEMQFDYTICEFEPKKEMIAFAQKHNCPIISYDIEFCFSGVPYIPYPSIRFDERTNTIHCGLFNLDNFLKKYQLTEEKLAVFAALTDEKNYPENYFMNFIKSLKTPIGYYKRHLSIIKWLGRTPKNQAVAQIYRYINEDDKGKFKEVEDQVRNLIRRKETLGVATEYLDNGNKIDFNDKDPQWFQKGVASKHIAIPLVNLARSDTILGSWAVADFDQDDAIMLSIDIPKYMYNLLNNFEKQEIKIATRSRDLNDKQVTLTPVTLTDSVQKPDYDGSSPFENGWDHLRPGLFQHFLAETLQGVDFSRLEKLSEELRLLMIALVYFSRRKSEDMNCEVYSVLLSYVALSKIFDNHSEPNTNLAKTDFAEKPILDSTIDDEKINETDKSIARGLLAEYFRNIEMKEASNMFDKKLLHPLVELQHCIQNLNFLNRLCGCPFKGTVYSQTYSASGVYSTVLTMRKDFGGDGQKFLQQKLNPAATVLAYLQGLIEFYEEFMYM